MFQNSFFYGLDTYCSFALENRVDTHDDSSHTGDDTIGQPSIWDMLFTACIPELFKLPILPVCTEKSVSGKVTDGDHIRCFLQLELLRVDKLALVVYNHIGIQRTFIFHTLLHLFTN